MNNKSKITVVFVVVILVMSVFSGCKKETPEVNFDRDFTLQSLDWGLAFVPDSTNEYRTNTLEHLETLDIQNVRIGQSWALREPTQYNYNMGPLEDRLDFYQKNNVEVLMTIDIDQFPEWTQGQYEDAFLISFEEFVRRTLLDFGGQIAIIQLGNEWDWEIDKSLDGDVELFIKMNNILYDEVKALDIENPPVVALGSISIGGVRALAFRQSRISNVYFNDAPMYSDEEIEEHISNIIVTSQKADQIFTECNYDIVDIHLYDDYWNWQHYVDAVKQVLSDAGKDMNTPIIVSEFGGPEPDFEPQEDYYRAEQLYSYVRTLDEIGIDTAYYFKLHEHTSNDVIYHPFSYLITEKNETTDTYEMLRRFGEKN